MRVDRTGRTHGAQGCSAAVVAADTGMQWECVVEGAAVVDLTELEDDPDGREGRRVQVDGALVRGRTANPDPEMLRSLLRGLQDLDLDAPVQRHDPAMT